jgi:hypothetical protein
VIIQWENKIGYEILDKIQNKKVQDEMKKLQKKNKYKMNSEQSKYEIAGRLNCIS